MKDLLKRVREAIWATGHEKRAEALKAFDGTVSRMIVDGVDVQDVKNLSPVVEGIEAFLGLELTVNLVEGSK